MPLEHSPAGKEVMFVDVCIMQRCKKLHGDLIRYGVLRGMETRCTTCCHATLIADLPRSAANCFAMVRYEMRCRYGLRCVTT